MNKLDIFCVTDKRIVNLENFSYNLGWVGSGNAPPNYLSCNTNDNIFFKEKYYSELTFQYWYWKNLIDLNKNSWIGFCQKRRFWLKKESKNKSINKDNFIDHILAEPSQEWKNYDAIICDSINLNNINKMKILKRGYRSLIKDPAILFNTKKQTILLHFDMHHGHGNIEKAIQHLNANDRNGFLNYVSNRTYYNPHIMFISKPHIIDRWFKDLFEWLFKCEQEFGFKKLKGYDTQRLYAFLAERYLSFWFKKYTKYLSWPWVFVDH